MSLEFVQWSEGKIHLTAVERFFCFNQVKLF